MFKKKASCAVVSNKLKKNENKKLIYCKNTFNFLNELAKNKRSASKAKIIAITGSSGKTTVKEYLGRLLSVFDETFYSPKSYNNHYGVPLSLCNLERQHKYGVFEVGMSKKGEIKKLSNLVKPNIAIITNVAEAHIENFKNIQGIAKAKSEIINNITKGGKLIINKEGKFFNYFKKKLKIKK